ncbi:MmcQ/YjbR family DNA-binding protein [Methanobrevibacter sp.]|uniref:MmcQ/YjbR family DNA-binding protein n=1 Tax=Methanobrevibacter sp. TaxID=66852 RepID=UPI0025CC2969|nr:MmcQ/YjbR family DNA-binding protein [Methanobrevibacter sp.]MBQ2666520.1 MmcQ/YjbR family DNA-binding protein [Methanobrevibacter sp.]
MRDLSEMLEKRSIIPERLADYGFNEDCIFEKTLSNPNFRAVIAYKNDTLTSRVVDLESGDDYILVDVKTPIGRFAAELKMEYEDIIDDVIEKCTIPDVFKHAQTRRLIDMVNDRYDTRLEFLWERFPKNAIWRNKNNSKWFGVLGAVDKAKIGLEGEGEIEIVILKNDDIPSIINGKTILEGYHMNKKYWICIPLDGRITDEELFALVERSFDLISG